jgi:DNA polymerase III alpha subunit
MGKKDPKVMAKQRGKDVDGAKKNGIHEKRPGRSST